MLHVHDVLKYYCWRRIGSTEKHKPPDPPCGKYTYSQLHFTKYNTKTNYYYHSNELIMFRVRCSWFIQYKKATLLLLYKELKYAYLICGNKMPTRCNRWYLLQILLHAQHVSDNTTPIIRSSRVLYRWSLPVVFGALVFKLSVWCGAEGYVSGLQAAALKQQPANRTHSIVRNMLSMQ